MGTRVRDHAHHFVFYPNGANTIDGGAYVCDCGATPLVADTNDQDDADQDADVDADRARDELEPERIVPVTINGQYSGPVTFHEATRDISRAIAVLTQVYPARLSRVEVAALLDTAHLIRSLDGR